MKATIQPGRVVADKYQIVRAIGRGGMGAVYEAEHLAMRRRIALKLLRPELALDPVMVARFKREAHAASRVQSRYVVTIHDFGEAAEGTLYLAMELLAGQSLQAMIDKHGAIEPQLAVRIAAAMARALADAHAVGVVHRDLKPDNVFVEPDGHVKVLDFGIAKILDVEGAEAWSESSALTQAGAIVGTPMYISPEAIGRKPVGPPADLYALGAILFQMIVGRPLFEEREPVLLMGMHLRVPPELLREGRPELVVPEELEQLVDQLLTKDPSARPSDAAAVAAQLEKLAEEVGAYGGNTAMGKEELVRALHAAEEVNTPVGLLRGPAHTPMAVAVTDAGTPKKLATWQIALGAVFAVSVVLGLGGTLFAVTWLGDDESTVPQVAAPRVAASVTPTKLVPPSPEPPPSEPAPPSAPQLSEIRVTIAPEEAARGARFTWDGIEMEGPVLRVPSDTSAHRLEVSAPGYATNGLDVVPDLPVVGTQLRLRVVRGRTPSKRRTIVRWRDGPPPLPPPP